MVEEKQSTRNEGDRGRRRGRERELDRGGKHGSPAGRKRNPKAPPPGAQLRHALPRHLRRPAPHAPLLPLRRQRGVALQLARDGRLAGHLPRPRGGLPPPPLRRGPLRPPRPHGPLPLRRLGRRRGPHGTRRLPLRVRRGAAPGLDVGPAHRHAAGLHGRVRVPAGEAAVHVLLDQLGIPADGRGGGAGIEREQRPAGGGVGPGVLRGVLHDAWGGGAVRFRSAAGGADVQEGQAGGHLLAGVGDSVGDVLLRHRLLHRRHAGQQGLPGDSYGSEELRARRSTILRGARGERDRLAILFLGSHWSHLLCLLSILRNHDRRPTPGHRDPRHHMLPGDVPGGERRVPCHLALGLGLLFLRRIQTCQEGKRKSSSSSRSRLDLQRRKCVEDRI